MSGKRGRHLTLIISERREFYRHTGHKKTTRGWSTGARVGRKKEGGQGPLRQSGGVCVGMLEMGGGGHYWVFGTAFGKAHGLGKERITEVPVQLVAQGLVHKAGINTGREKNSTGKDPMWHEKGDVKREGEPHNDRGAFLLIAASPA